MATPAETLLRVNDIHTYYGDSYVLQGVSLDLAPGSIVAILGRNGMGKTTLIRSIAGLTPPRQGSITYKGTELTGLAPHLIARQGIGLVPQGRRIFKSLSVRENLLLPTSGLARDRQARSGNGEWDLEAVFKEFPKLAQRAKNMGDKLSGGEQQMLAIGRALMANPDLVLMDEPSEGLAPVVVQQIGEIMRRIRDKGHSILLVEQNFSMAVSVADYVYVISSGRMAYEGRPKELMAETEILDRHLGI